MTRDRLIRLGYKLGIDEPPRKSTKSLILAILHRVERTTDAVNGLTSSKRTKREIRVDKRRSV